jgi:hypothetical protein
MLERLRHRQLLCLAHLSGAIIGGRCGCEGTCLATARSRSLATLVLTVTLMAFMDCRPDGP